MNENWDKKYEIPYSEVPEYGNKKNNWFKLKVFDLQFFICLPVNILLI